MHGLNSYFKKLREKKIKGKNQTIQGDRSCVSGSPRYCGSKEKYIAQSRGVWKGFSEKVMSMTKPVG